MVLYIVIAALAVLIGYRIPDKENPYNNRIIAGDRDSVVSRICLAGLFMLLFLPLFLRIDTGNDYPTYIERFHDIVRGNYVVTEKGFNLVVRFIYYLFNCENYLAVFGFFGFFTILVFLYAIYKESHSFFLSLLLFICLGLYFQCFNTVRYYFALSLVLFAMGFAVRGKYVRFILVVLFASLFHKSSLVVIPIYLLSKINWKAYFYVIFGFVAATGPVLKDYYMSLFLRLYPSYEKEEGYIEAGGLSIVSIIRCAAVLLICLFFFRDTIKENKENRFYFNLNFFALLGYSFFYFIPFVSRIGYYMTISHILFIPSLLREVKDEKKRNILKAAVIAGAVIYFILFLFRCYDDYIKILPYNTFLFKDISFVGLED